MLRAAGCKAENIEGAESFKEMWGDALLLQEKELWDWVSNEPIKEIGTIRAAMGFIGEAAEAILNGEPRDLHLNNIKLLAGTQGDDGYRRLSERIITAFRDGSKDGLKATVLTTMCVALMASSAQRIWPREWNSPSYRKNKVWQPEEQGDPGGNMDDSGEASSRLHQH